MRKKNCFSLFEEIFSYQVFKTFLLFRFSPEVGRYLNSAIKTLDFKQDVSFKQGNPSKTIETLEECVKYVQSLQ